jgi:hypothetical protein
VTSGPPNHQIAEGFEGADEKFINAAIDAQRVLRPYAETIEAATRASRSVADMIGHIERNPALRQVQEIMRRQETMNRAAFGPLYELRQSKLLDVIGPGQREIERIRQMMDGYEARFCLPEMAETLRLLVEVNKPRPFGRFGITSSRVREAMESMRTPWLDVQEKVRSIGAFAELQGIGHVLRAMPGFDEKLSATLRLGLGDWRDPITWRPEIFTDLGARADFYVGLGFNPALTDFPLPAFEQGLNIAGLHCGTPKAVPKSRGENADEAEEDGLARTNAAHDRLQRLERLLRKFIDDEMTRAFGTDWPKRRLPNGFYDDWNEKKRKAEESGAEERPLIDYADFTHYAPLICRTDNWRDVFRPYFTRPESVRESFQRLHPIRLDVAHARLITKDDELLLCVEVKRLVKVIRQG